MAGEILVALWFFVPVAFANMAPVVASKIPWLSQFKTPIDMGKTFRGHPILGANKTWRGLIAGILAATLTFWVQQQIVGQGDSLNEFPGNTAYVDLPTILFGVLFGLGTLGGDAVKSFIKRQLDTAPGKPWPFFDQVGEILGAILITLPLVTFNLWVYACVAILWVVVDFGFSMLVYLTGWKERPL